MKILRIAASAAALVALPATSMGAVVQMTYGGASAGTPITGSNQHLPPLSAPAMYPVGPGLGPSVAAFRQSGGYTADINGTVSRARGYLSHWLDDTCGKKATVAKVRKCKAMVVSDIDDTVLSWYDLYASPEGNWGPSPAVASAFIQSCTGPPITPSVAFLNQARKRGVALVLITGRKEADRAPTAACMPKIGLSGFEQLILRQPSQDALTAEAFKSAERKKLERKGWKIALSIGDQVSDMSGGYADAGFLLPNPMYFIP